MKRTFPIVVVLAAFTVSGCASAQRRTASSTPELAYASPCNRDCEQKIIGILNDTRRAHPDAWQRGPASSRDLTFVNLAVLDLRRAGIPAGLNGKRGGSDISHDVFVLPNPNGCRDTSGRYPGLTLVDFVVGSESPTASVTYNDVSVDAKGQCYADGRYIEPEGGVVVPPPPPPPPGLEFTLAHRALLARVATTFGVPSGDSDQEFARRVAEQFAFSFPSEGWGVKSADPDRPQSGNVIARNSGGRLTGYQIVPIPREAPGAIDLAGQHFIPVSGIDHVGGGVTPPPPPPPPPDNVAQLLETIRSLLEQLHTKVDAQTANDALVRQDLLLAEQASRRMEGQLQQILDSRPTAIDFPEYVGTTTLLGRPVTVVLRPRPQ